MPADMIHPSQSSLLLIFYHTLLARWLGTLHYYVLPSTLSLAAPSWPICTTAFFFRLRNVSCLCGRNCFRRLSNICNDQFCPLRNVLCICGQKCFCRLRILQQLLLLATDALCFHGQICFASYAMSHNVSQCLSCDVLQCLAKVFSARFSIGA